jgi:hypothetical protein
LIVLDAEVLFSDENSFSNLDKNHVLQKGVFSLNSSGMTYSLSVCASLKN